LSYELDDYDLEKSDRLTTSTLRCSNEAYPHIFRRNSTGNFGKMVNEVDALLGSVSLRFWDAMLREEFGESLKTG
jgi:hypothetical protein